MNKNEHDDGSGKDQDLLAYFKNSSPARGEELADLFSELASLRARRDDLDGHLQKLNGLDESTPSNILPFRKRPPMPERSNVQDKRWILRLDCLIESNYVSEIHKMATELHAHSRRYAFVEFRDLDKSARGSVTDMLALGAITLFVPSILDLTLREQETLSRLTELESLQRPLLMVGATLPYSELRGRPGIDAEFLARLSRAYIKLTRPFTEYKEQGLIHYFLDSLSESPT